MSLRDYWYIGCEARQLGRQPLQRVIFDETVALWRDADGKPHAVKDRCAHRNAPLSAGTVQNGCLVCPYHAWSYAADGNCLHIPSLAKDSPIPPTARVPFYPTIEQDSYIWIYMGSAQPDHSPRRFPHCEEYGWTTFRMINDFSSSVEACLENFLDCPHTSTVHRGWFRKPDARELDAVVRRHRDGVDVEFQNEPVTDSWITRLFYPKRSQLKHTDKFLMPNLSRVDYFFDPSHHFIISSQATPVSANQTRVFTVITFRYGRIGWLVRLLFEPISRLIIKQDVDILKLHGENVRRHAGEDYVHVETDLIGLQLGTLRRDAERGVNTPAEPTEKRIRIRF